MYKTTNFYRLEAHHDKWTVLFLLFRTRPRYDRADPYDAYYRDRYPPPPPDRFRPYPDPYDRRPLPPPRDPYYRDRSDPYARPPPEYYGRR